VNATILTPFRLFLPLLWLAGCLFASSHPAQAQYYFDHLNTAQGLSQSTVKVTFQDSRGFLWFGTTDGLNRYDGYEFRRFRHQANNPNSLCGNDIMALAEDGSGNVWVGTRGNGLCYFDPLLPADQWSYFQLANIPYRGRLLTIEYDRDGSHYNRGVGLSVWADGQLLRRRATLGKIRVP
jgi:ligand-binding sensor domain-containing protein